MKTDQQMISTMISTHTSLAGRDPAALSRFADSDIISTHTSLAGRDEFQFLAGVFRFISTHTSLAGRDDGQCGQKTI